MHESYHQPEVAKIQMDNSKGCIMNDHSDPENVTLSQLLEKEMAISEEICNLIELPELDSPKLAALTSARKAIEKRISMMNSLAIPSPTASFMLPKICIHHSSRRSMQKLKELFKMDTFRTNQLEIIEAHCRGRMCSC